MVKFSAKINNTYARYKRVWRLLKKPSMKEFKLISKVTAVGVVIIGAMGFLIALFMKLFY